MKIASFIHGSEYSYGVVVGDGIVDLGRRYRDRFPSLRALLDAAALDEAAAMAAREPADFKIDDVTFHPVVPNPDKIICSGVNYRLHIEESDVDVPDRPILFTRLSNTLVGHGQPLICPAVSEQFDWEGELCAVIGRGGRHIPEERALSHVAGYTCFIDGSVRDYQAHSIAAGKNFFATGGFGPWLTTADEIGDPAALTLVTRLNGEVMQETTTDLMIFSVPQLISYVSTVTPLVPGDILVTGTPSGVGAARNPPIWMGPGDTIEVEISKVGVLQHPIVAENPESRL